MADMACFRFLLLFRGLILLCFALPYIYGMVGASLEERQVDFLSGGQSRSSGSCPASPRA